MTTTAGDDAVTAYAPGRVVLIGDHTDHCGGSSITMAVDLGTTVTGRRGGDVVELQSDEEPGIVRFTPPAETAEGAEGSPPPSGPAWGAYPRGVARAMALGHGFTGQVRSTLPVGAGLASSASLELALLLAFGFEGTPDELAATGQQAEHLAVRVPCGPLDQVSIAHARADQLTVLDLGAGSIGRAPLAEDLAVVVMHSGQQRSLDASPYARRRAEAEAAARSLGHLPSASPAEVASIADPVLRRRARHVQSECERVAAFAEAVGGPDRRLLGELMAASHRSLRDDFEVSTPTLDHLVARLAATPGVIGARLTGAGFGGCVVALEERGALGDPAALTGRGWRTRPSGGPEVHASVH